MSSEQPNFQDILTEALKDETVLKLYANGSIQSITSSDIVLLLRQNDTSIAVVNMSFNMAKSLAQGLNDLVIALEDRLGRPILSTNEVNEKIGSNQ